MRSSSVARDDSRNMRTVSILIRAVAAREIFAVDDAPRQIRPRIHPAVNQRHANARARHAKFLSRRNRPCY